MKTETKTEFGSKATWRKAIREYAKCAAIAAKWGIHHDLAILEAGLKQYRCPIKLWKTREPS